MAQDYTEYLAINVLNEQQVVGSASEIPVERTKKNAGQLPPTEQSLESAQQFSETVSHRRV